MVLTNETLIHEKFKFNLIAKLMAVLLFIRAAQISISYYFYQNSLLREEIVFTTFYFLILIGFFIGKKTHWFAAALLLIQYKFDDYFSCHNVMSNVVSFLCFYLMIYSYNNEKLQQSEISESSFLSRILGAKYLVAFLWGILHFVSVFSHFEDMYWRNGTAFGKILCNPFLSRHFSFFQSLNQSNYDLFSMISGFSSYWFLFFQTTMLLFFVFKKTRFIFYLWFLTFNISITFFLNIGILMHFSWLCLYLIVPKIKLQAPAWLSFASELRLGSELSKTNKVFFLVIGLYIFLNAPFLKTATHKFFWVFREWDTYHYINKKLTMVGLSKLNLFNSYQIANGNKWFTIYKKEDNQWIKIPLVDTDGSRLSYYPDILQTKNHGSDILLGNTMQYSFNIDEISYSKTSTPNKKNEKIYERLINYDHNKHSPKANSYKIEFYSRKTENPKFEPHKVGLDSVKYIHIQ